MSIDLSKLLPAPWEPDHEMVYFGAVDDRGRPDSLVVAECRSPEVAQFVALARNAIDVLIRRGWAVRHSEFDGMWWLAHAGTPHPKAFRDWSEENAFADPFTTLIEADKWYRENVEGGAE